MFTFLFLILFPFSFARLQEDHSLEALELILKTITNEKRSHSIRSNTFRVDQCLVSKIDWSTFVINKNQTGISFQFKDGCDISGEFAPHLLRPFDMDLNIRNLYHFSNVKSKNRITLILERNPILKIELMDGLLTGEKTLIRFEAIYHLRLKTSSGVTTTEHLGGDIIIREINSKKIYIKKKLKIVPSTN